MSALGPDAVTAIDTQNAIGDVLDLPNQLRDALWRCESAGLASQEAPHGLVVAGMGGSAIGGQLARAALGDRASRPLLSARSYELPAWTTPETAVLCASYSGDTEETLACFEAAGAIGSPRIVVTTGGKIADLAREAGVPVIGIPAGLQPRHAVAYMTVAALEAAALFGVGESLHTEIDVAAAHAERLVEEWGPEGAEDSEAKRLAGELHGTIPVVGGAGTTAPVAYRWKCQLNENAKVPAFAHELPELDHNEIAGWSGAPELGPFAAVFLDDCDLHPRVRSRIELTRSLVEPHAAKSILVSTRGESRTERVVSLVLLGDLISVYLAVLRGVDPTPVQVIENLKGELALI